MEIGQDLIQLSTTLANIVGKQSVSTIMDRIKLAKTGKEKNEAIASLEEIITELISEKSQLIQVAQAYEEKLITQKISDEEIDYITTSLIPILEKLIQQGDYKEEEKSKNLAALETFKPLLSKETFHIMQLLGFNFKVAIGNPLTYLVKSLINSKVPASIEQQIQYEQLNTQREVEYYRFMQDEDAYERHLASQQKR